MLSPQDQELLTASVDGELTPRQQRRVARLLRHSGEARTLHAQLQQDAQMLRALPRLSAPRDVTAAVMARIATVPPQRNEVRHARPTPTTTPRRLRFPAWSGLAAAAAVLLLVGAASFFLNTPEDEGRTPNRTAGQKHEDPEKPGVLGERDLVRAPNDDGKKQLPAPEVKQDDNQPMPPEKEEENEPLPPVKPRPPMVPDDKVLAAGGKELIRSMERVDLDLPTIHKLHTLDQSAELDKLWEQFATGGAFRVEIPSRDATRGLERLRGVLTGNKVNVIIDPVAQARLKKTQWRSDYAVFLENVSVKDLVGLLRDAGVADRQAGEKKGSEQRYDGSLVVRQMSRWDVTDVTNMLGLDPIAIRPSPPQAPTIDIRTPLPDLTSKQVSDALEGKGTPRITSTGQSAFVLPLTGPRVRSAELKRYLDARQPARPHTLQVLLVLRSL